jgi:hypothetical protein
MPGILAKKKKRSVTRKVKDAWKKIGAVKKPYRYRPESKLI